MEDNKIVLSWSLLDRCWGLFHANFVKFSYSGASNLLPEYGIIVLRYHNGLFPVITRPTITSLYGHHQMCVLYRISAIVLWPYCRESLYKLDYLLICSISTYSLLLHADFPVSASSHSPNSQLRRIR